MAEKLTPQQEKAVRDRGGKLLISAAAGSGKTKVLVDRLMCYLTDPADPANLDEFVIITFTRAAADELRGKIAAKLTERIAEMPENRHLQRQLQRLYMAKISTIHAFCGELLKEYAYRIDLPADFRIAEETECAELKEQTMEQLLDEVYDTVADDADLRAFMDTLGLGRDDSEVTEIVLRVYRSAQCHPDPAAWLDQCGNNADATSVTDAAKTLWGEYLMDDLFAHLDLWIPAMTRCAEAAAAAGMTNQAELLWSNVALLTDLRGCRSWDGVHTRSDLSFGTLREPGKNSGDPELMGSIKAIRRVCRAEIKKKLANFSQPNAAVLDALKKSAPAIRGLVRMVSRFCQVYEKRKRSQHILDYDDLEHKTLELLLGRSHSGPTVVAGEIGERFREVMVDEYQDTNAVQDAIFAALTHKRNNLFLVGDVKQSIYQFRLADPGIFLEKYNRYVPAEEALPGQGRKVLLTSNFRSGGGILSAANAVFRTCMSPTVGGLSYGEAEMLQEGIPHIPLGEPEVELHTIQAQEDATGCEADFVAERIQTLLDGTHMVRQGDELRPITAGDIVILLRAPSTNGGYFRKALEARGIRCVSAGDTNLLKAEEIQSLVSLLRVIDNPRQDIPLLAALASPIFGFTADDLAVLRARHKNAALYDAILHDAGEKCQAFREVLTALRKEARMNPLAVLLEQIFRLTRMDSVYAAMPNGKTRLANLQAFYQTAINFEANGRRDLRQFLAHLDALPEKGLLLPWKQENTDAVTILSIHKSKGLEYPVVFLSALSRGFSNESQKGKVLCDRTLGLGAYCIEEKRRLQYSTIARQAVAVKSKAEELSEEMRVLYVAMTRARDRLIMTYSSTGLKNDLLELIQRMDLSGNPLMARTVGSVGEWILLAALRRTEAGALFSAADWQPKWTVPGEPAWKITYTESQPPVENVSPVDSGGAKRLPAGTVERMRQSLAFRYPHIAATAAPSKQTATQRKGREKDQEAAENAQPPKNPVRAWRKPSFAASTVEATAYGSAIHAALQYIRYGACTDAAGVAREISRLVDEGFLSQEQGKLVDCGQIAEFFATGLGQKLRVSQNVLREFKFSILDHGDAYGPGLEGEQVLLQGVVDCALLEDDGITVIDFKTDHVTDATVEAVAERYALQVQTYAHALSRIYRKPIKSALLYFFRLGRFVQIQTDDPL